MILLTFSRLAAGPACAPSPWRPARQLPRAGPPLSFCGSRTSAGPHPKRRACEEWSIPPCCSPAAPGLILPQPQRDGWAGDLSFPTGQMPLYMYVHIYHTNTVFASSPIYRPLVTRLQLFIAPDSSLQVLGSIVSDPRRGCFYICPYDVLALGRSALGRESNSEISLPLFSFPSGGSMPARALCFGDRTCVCSVPG